MNIRIGIAVLCVAMAVIGCMGRDAPETALSPAAEMEAPAVGDKMPDDGGKTADVSGKREDIKAAADQTLVADVDLSDYFQGIAGTMVIYAAGVGEYIVYNRELAEKRSSPCSTFKIVSALAGLRANILESEDTLIVWNGTEYPIAEWNRDQTLEDAFRTSCVWYFRDVVDRVGKERADGLLAELAYGNRDTSQWEGGGVNGGYAELNGFWLESSLLISPMEQVGVMRTIFENNTDSRLMILKNIMELDAGVYGKTGTGYKDGRCVDAWFVGFAEKDGETYYIAVRLEPEDNAVSGKTAQEIALNIINDRLGQAY